jgi:F-type H+-transporting ATPase subunit delta
MAKLASTTYGEALFELAVSENKEDEIYAEITSLKEILADNPDFSKFMNHPNILKEDKLKMIEDVFRGRVCDELVGFLHLLVVKERYPEIDAILQCFTDLMKKHKGIGVAFVTTPKELSAPLRENVEKKLLETTDFRTMEMHYEVDESLIGGMVIRIGDRVVDSSVKTKLTKLQSDLLKTQL